MGNVPTQVKHRGLAFKQQGCDIHKPDLEPYYYGQQTERHLVLLTNKTLIAAYLCYLDLLPFRYF